MTTSLLSDPTMLLSTPEVMIASHQPSPASTTQISYEEPEQVTCDCCGLTEECTQSYIEMIREHYMGKWICGLCSEAVKYEVIRTKRLLTTEEAMARHMNMCYKFKSSSPPPNPTGRLISAMTQILRRSLDSPRMLRSMPSSPSKDKDDYCVSNVLSRSDSC
ncbi:hypothetical protein BRARA_G03134 [Brassica rapa]|uniref:DUF1677 family protein n=3 Tax=Brassica TaxID=3705 RepID=A0A397YR65_BRACM|nr:uncharacterized protein LOC103831761 [Brassica rapa]XP_013649558.2 uncharacterized protein LOC106354222 [Brassica napus]RID55895.1 hypothetical protein BRARA_G03134 [Brassica rapa]CAF2197447.1 unnamed protein product [Brassica napus]